MTPADVAGPLVTVGDIEMAAPELVAGSVFANPKSSTLTLPSGLMTTFDGFRSLMHDATFVRSIERIGNLDSDMPRFVDRKRAVRDPRLERRTLDHLHDDDLIRAEPFESVNFCDVRVIERGEYLRLAGKSRDAIRVIGKAVRQDFERNVTTELRVASPIHRSHSALADRRGDLVDADAGA